MALALASVGARVQQLFVGKKQWARGKLLPYHMARKVRARRRRRRVVRAEALSAQSVSSTSSSTTCAARLVRGVGVDEAVLDEEVALPVALPEHRAAEHLLEMHHTTRPARRAAQNTTSDTESSPPLISLRCVSCQLFLTSGVNSSCGQRTFCKSKYRRFSRSPDQSV